MQDNEKKNEFRIRTLKRILPVAATSLLIPFIFCFATPFALFAKNSAEFGFSLNDFLPFSLLYGFVLFAVGFLSLLFLKPTPYKIGLAIHIAFALMLVVQFNFLNIGLISLGGDNLGSSGSSTLLKVFDTIIWIAVIGGAVGITFIKDKKGIIKYGAIILTVIIIATQIISPVVVAVSYPEAFKTKSGSELVAADARVLTDEGLTEVSKNKNVFIFVIDRFDEGYAEVVLQEKPGIFSELEGFTLFKDNMSLYGHTYPGIVNLLTRSEYSPEAGKRRVNFLNESYKNEKTMSVLHENGYKINLYTQPFYGYSEAQYLPAYVSNSTEVTKARVINRDRLAMVFLGVSAYSCFPTLTKDLIGGSLSSDVFNEYVDKEGTDGYKEYGVDNEKVLKKVSKAVDKDEAIEDNLFSFIHIAGCHKVNKNFLNGKGNNNDKKTCVKNMRECFDIIDPYLKKLKKIGAYKDATIIITGDHAAPVNDAADIDGVKLTAMLIKPSGKESGGISENLSPVSHRNMWSTIMDCCNIERPAEYKNVPSYFEVGESETAERTFCWHTYGLLLSEYDYTVTGSGRDFKNWKKTDKKNYNFKLMD